MCRKDRGSYIGILSGLILLIVVLTGTAVFGLPSTDSTHAAAIESNEFGTTEIDDQTSHDTTTEHTKSSHSRTVEFGAQLPLHTIVPFIGILLSIAIFPLISPRFWHDHFPKVAIAWAAIFAIPFTLEFRGEAVYHILEIYLHDYIPFIILIWALFTVSGGIHVKGTLRGTPKLNFIFLLIGTILASMIGTTGASMLLIRPLLRANSWRRYKVHTVVFFIFLVSNIGGSLTPLGDPPLFLGFLHGVPFFWTLNLFSEMALLALALLAIFYFLDSYFYRKDIKQTDENPKNFEVVPLKIEGLHNIVFLAGIVGSVLLSGLWHIGEVAFLGQHMAIQGLLREGVMLLMGFLSITTTRKEIYVENNFTWFPMKEVAFLFASIFATITPALAILKAGEHGAAAPILRAVTEPAHYFWITGIFSSFLDNAPTYLTFFNSALASLVGGGSEREAVRILISEYNIFLEAISCGAVFMGAMTYIGNAPNFMVKSIAEESGVPMPSFFGYMIKYSLIFLVPLFVLITLIFFGIA